MSLTDTLLFHPKMGNWKPMLSFNRKSGHFARLAVILGGLLLLTVSPFLVSIPVLRASPASSNAYVGTVIANIATGNRPGALAFDSLNGNVYVSLNAGTYIG